MRKKFQVGFRVTDLLLTRECFFMRNSIELLGFIDEKSAKHVSWEKMKVVFEVPLREDAEQLRSVSGWINDFSEFLPNPSKYCFVFQNLLKMVIEQRMPGRNRRRQEAAFWCYTPGAFWPKVATFDARWRIFTAFGSVLDQKFCEGSEKLLT